MKNTLQNLIAVFIILLSACSSATQRATIPTIEVAPTAISTRTPTKASSSATPTVTKVIQTPTIDNTAFLSNLLPSCGDTNLSPNQSWAIGFCGDDETWIVDVNQTTKWVISYGEYYGSKFDSGIGVIAPFYWTSNDRYLYLTIQRGASGPIYFVNGWGLASLDLENGNISEILKPVEHQYYSFSLSPDGKYLAYILQPASPLIVKVINIETKDVTSYRLTPEYNQAGAILWSPDAGKIVLEQASIDDTELEPVSISVVMINLPDGSQQLVVSDNAVQMHPQNWIDENTLELFDIDGKVWVYNFEDQTMIEKTE